MGASYGSASCVESPPADSIASGSPTEPPVNGANILAKSPLLRSMELTDVWLLRPLGHVFRIYTHLRFRLSLIEMATFLSSNHKIVSHLLRCRSASTEHNQHGVSAIPLWSCWLQV